MASNDPTAAAPVGGNPGTTLGQQRLNVFKKAAEIWAGELDSPIEITVLASMEPLACTATTATLGSAGQRFIYSDFNGVGLFPGAEFPDVWYGSALASKRAGLNVLIADPPTGVTGPVTDIRARFNSELGKTGCLTGSFWYYGFDTNQAASQNNLLVVLLHELAHGLGFQQFANITTGEQIDGQGDIYGQYLLDTTAGLTWNQMTNAQRAASSINSRKLVWDGATVASGVPAAMAYGRPSLKVTAPAGDCRNVRNRDGVVWPSAGGARRDGTGGAWSRRCECRRAIDHGRLHRIHQCGGTRGKIALVDRGTCGFIVKVKNAQIAGAIAVIVADNAAGSPPAGLGGVDPTITIPSGRVTLSDGNLLKANLAAGVTATLGVDMSLLSGADQLGRVLISTRTRRSPDRRSRTGTRRRSPIC